MQDEHNPKTPKTSRTDADEVRVYQIRIKGHLGRHWTEWFGNVTITLEANGETLLTISSVDQAGLYGLLRKVRDLGMPLISVNCINDLLQGRRETMKAIVYTEYGPPEVAQYKEVEKPTPQDNEVRIKVHATTLGPAEVAFRSGEPFIVKLFGGLRKPKNEILGGSFAGEIDTVGKAVTAYKPGDKVFGVSGSHFGSLAQYFCVPDDVELTTLPRDACYEDAVSILETLTALTFLRDIAKVQPGQKVLINGASGAVGAYGVQLAKYYGAEVTGVCSTANLDLVKSLSADRVIDYTQQDFTRMGQTYDVIFDAIGKSTFAKCEGVLTQDGIYMTTVPSLGILYDVLRTQRSRKKARFAASGLMQTVENVVFVKELFEAGHIRAVIDRCYPLEETQDAYRYVETERKKGSVVIMLDHADKN